MTAIDVSIVVCTYNRGRLLRNALASLTALETEGNFRYEVVAIDNASTDDTGQVIEEAARNSPVPVRGVREPRAGVACARNRGIREARGPWIAFFDDDQVADPRWLIELLAMARQAQARCAGGANRLLLPQGGPDQLSPVCRTMLGEAVGSERPRRYCRKAAFGTGNLLIHRSVFAEVGAFDESLHESGEDTDLFRRLCTAKIDAWYTPEAVVYHVIPGYRLKDDYLRWRSLRVGGTLARRNRQDWGRVMFVPVVVARLGQALVLHVPRLLWARLRRAEGQTLGARCLLWSAQGYLRFALSFMAPKLFGQQRFFSQLEFRTERQRFAGG